MALSTSDIARDVAIGHSAHRRLIDRLTGLVDAGTFDVDEPSRLPGWTKSMLVTHLARNADAHRRMFEGAALGEVREQYEGGLDARNAGIEDGRGATAEAVLADLESATQALEAAWASTDWIGSGIRSPGNESPLTDLPFLRVREVELHHVDLDIGCSFDDLDPTYVRLEIARLEMLWTARQPMGLTKLPDVVLALEPPRRLAWLTGRIDVAGVRPANIF